MIKSANLKDGSILLLLSRLDMVQIEATGRTDTGGIAAYTVDLTEVVKHIRANQRDLRKLILLVGDDEQLIRDFFQCELLVTGAHNDGRKIKEQ